VVIYSEKKIKKKFVHVTGGVKINFFVARIKASAIMVDTADNHTVDCPNPPDLSPTATQQEETPQNTTERDASTCGVPQRKRDAQADEGAEGCALGGPGDTLPDCNKRPRVLQATVVPGREIALQGASARHKSTALLPLPGCSLLFAGHARGKFATDVLERIMGTDCTWGDLVIPTFNSWNAQHCMPDGSVTDVQLVEQLGVSLKICLDNRLPGMLVPGVHPSMVTPRIGCILPLHRPEFRAQNMNRLGRVNWVGYFNNARINGPDDIPKCQSQVLACKIPLTRAIGLREIAA
jgi:hypothetical protein